MRTSEIQIYFYAVEKPAKQGFCRHSYWNAEKHFNSPY